MQIVVFSPHPDDTEVSCGGTIAKYVNQGHKIFNVIATDGSAGGEENIDPAKLIEMRKNEAMEASKVIGAELLWLGIKDEFLLDNEETRIKFIDTIRKCNADVILTCCPEDYHPDHKMISRIVFNTSFTSSLPLVKTNYEALEKVPILYFYDTVYGINFIPDEYVDISDFIDIKIEMLSKHKSQIDFMRKYYNVDLIDHFKITSRSRGLQCSVSYAEGFKVFKGFPRIKTERYLP